MNYMIGYQHNTYGGATHTYVCKLREEDGKEIWYEGEYKNFDGNWIPHGHGTSFIWDSIYPRISSNARDFVKKYPLYQG